MRRFITVGLVAVACLAFARPKPAVPYRVVFDLTSRDTLDQKAVLRWVKEVTAAEPQAEVEVVMYAKGFELVKDDAVRE